MKGQYTILIVEDDPNDVDLFRLAFERIGISNPVQVARDGEEAIAYLSGQGEYAQRDRFPYPDFIMTDLKMPRKNGFDVLLWLKEENSRRIIPTVVFSSSNHVADINKAYHLGANAYLVKPPNFKEMIAVLKQMHDFWNTVEKPVLRAGDSPAA